MSPVAKAGVTRAPPERAPQGSRLREATSDPAPKLVPELGIRLRRVGPERERQLLELAGERIAVIGRTGLEGVVDGGELVSHGRPLSAS